MTRIGLKKAATPNIPTASTADIAFLLIIFFMVSTHFRTEKGLKINLPRAEMTERILKRRNVAAIWIDATGRMTVQDNWVNPSTITALMSEKVIENPEIVVLLQADKDVKYGFVTDVLEALKDARALKVTFATSYGKGGG
ncbi:MAG: biopolymer transporter ExbD [candidate division WOR-3 bacterium]